MERNAEEKPRESSLQSRIGVAWDGLSITPHTAGIPSLATERTPESVPRLQKGQRHEH
jgi:hypothetical protein